MKEAVRSYSTLEIARRLGISLQTVQRWVDSGRLKAWKTPGGHRRIDALSAELLFEEQAPQKAIEHPETTAGTPLNAVSVVIVDDDPLDRELIVTLVHIAVPNAHLLVAGNGFQGLVLIAKWAPDIVVADLHLPHMDGIEMIRNVLADTATRPRLLMAVSEKPVEKLLVWGQLPTEVVVMQKPLNQAKFIRALRQGAEAP
jgi:excisionase family DNA binding protein